MGCNVLLGVIEGLLKTTLTPFILAIGFGYSLRYRSIDPLKAFSALSLSNIANTFYSPIARGKTAFEIVSGQSNREMHSIGRVPGNVYIEQPFMR